jgi:hypothetical protein
MFEPGSALMDYAMNLLTGLFCLLAKSNIPIGNGEF